ncbi:MAG: DUF881 domain-containing protein [Acidothermus sp.]|nr:DUF881 domain-containing protein [Acidothermus sp.]
MTAAEPTPGPEGPRRGRRFGLRGQAVVAVLCALLGFAIVTQVDTNASSRLSTARQADLVDVLDNLNARAEQLRTQIAAEQSTLRDLTSGTDQTQAALTEARHQLQTLQILAGTIPVTGPGIILAIDDPTHAVTADVFVDAIQELRDAGAEAIEIRGAPPAAAGGRATPAPTAVRLVASSYVVDSPDGRGVVVDGVGLAPPYDLLAIGDPETLDRALAIPGGVLDTIKGKNATATVSRHANLEITAVRTPAPTANIHPVASAPPG